MSNNETISISPKKINEKYAKIVKEAITEVERNGLTTSDVLLIEEHNVAIKDAEKYKALKRLEDILKIEKSEVSKGDRIFNDFYIPSKDFDEFIKIVNSGITGIEFPGYIQQIGIIPSFAFDKEPEQEIYAPEPKYYTESMQSYEERLERYYKKLGIDVGTDEYGIRYSYPHERVAWKNGQAVDMGKDYVNEYYNRYRASAMRNVSVDGLGKDKEVEETQEVTERKPLNFKYSDPEFEGQRAEKKRIKEKKKGGFVNGGRKILGGIADADKFMGKNETWGHIKKFVVNAALIGGIGFLGFKGVSKIFGAFAGIGKAVAAGTIIPASAIAGMLGSVALTAAGAAILIHVYKRSKKKKIEELTKDEVDEIEKEVEEEVEQEVEEEVEKAVDKTKDVVKEKETQIKSNPTPADKITATVRTMQTPEEIENYLAGVIVDMKQKQEEIKENKKLIDISTTMSPEDKKQKVQKLNKNYDMTRNIQYQAIDAAILSQEISIADVQQYGGIKK